MDLLFGAVSAGPSQPGPPAIVTTPSMAASPFPERVRPIRGRLPFPWTLARVMGKVVQGTRSQKGLENHSVLRSLF